MKAFKFILCLLFVLVLVNGRQPAAAAPPSKQAAHPAQVPVDYRFGVIESYENPTEANNLGVAWTRVRFQWADVQAGGPDSWTPTVTEGQIDGEIGSGRTVVGLLIGIPDWARDGSLPAGLWLPHDDPNNTWANFVRQAVSRYDGRISHWIIWNEPDINDSNAPGHTWSGSVNDFFQLQRVAYLIAKETNPNVKIHLPAFTYFWNPNYIYELMDVIVTDPAAAENNYYFDAITAHLYFQPDSVFNIIQSFYGAVLGRGIPWKPLWLVETNAPPSKDPAWPVSNWTFQVTLDEQAAYMPQALAVAMAAGAQRIAVYKLQDVPGDETANPEPFGLLRLDGSRRPAFSSYQIAIRYMAGTQSANRERWDHVGQVKLDQGDYITHVLFSRLPAPQQPQIEATANTAVLVDMWGSRRTIAAQDGLFTVDLPGAPCVQTAGDYCMIGGPVSYLIQAVEGGVPPVDAPPADTAPATDTPDPDTATPTAETEITKTATTAPIQTATDTPTFTNIPSQTPRPTDTVTATAVPIQPTPTQISAAAPTNQPTNTPIPATTVAESIPTPASNNQLPATAANLSFIFMGGGLLLALGLGVLYWRNGR
ncbi:MAG: hypothetical protein GY796_34790 [Chloroflexi bacterium]|nr:hypothetical protein [Chloroflexota bacterium]